MMDAKALANVPVTLTIEGVDSSGQPANIELRLAPSMPLAVETVLGEDIIAIGKKLLTPYERLQPQLGWLAAKEREAREARDIDAAAQFAADRQAMLRSLQEGILSGRADDLSREAYFEKGRGSVEGLCREIADRAKHAGQPVTLAELRAVITDANAGQISARLQEVLGEGRFR